MRMEKVLALVSLTLVACGNGASGSAAAAQDKAAVVQSNPNSQHEGNGGGEERGSRAVDRVLLISVDGLHQIDLARFVALSPSSTLARLAHRGVQYSSARTTTPSDSFPGLLALVTGGTPRSTGVYYDDSYDRRLYPPGSNCQGNPGTECTYFEIAEADFTKLFSPLNPDNLPHAKDAQGHCLPVYPHDFIKVNTVFEVIRGAGGHTAWSDKHPAYDLVNGPSGTGVEDLYTPEINSPIANGGTRQWRQPEGDARPVRRDDQLAAAEQGRRLHHLRARGHGL
ncbi:MAG: alkaline phosphatase family protein [Deltaproteobacteria bacterium]|nr:MAG: alkaline phosphatase family protein [Deltaproteobacteria bacterium]